MRVELPYGLSSIEVEIPEGRLAGILEAPAVSGADDPEPLVRKALARPVGAPPLQELAARRRRPGQTRVAIAISDASRPNVEVFLIPGIMAELARAGISPEQVTFVVGTGSHRRAHGHEIEAMVGPWLRQGAQVENHNAFESEMVFLGRTSDGLPVHINAAFVRADLKIAVGTVLPHPFAGFSGGAKAIAVGIAGAQTIAGTHTPAMLEHAKTGLGVMEGNPFQRAAREMARMAGLAFIVNATVDSQGRAVDIVAGDVEAAHDEIIARSARSMFQSYFDEPSDICIVSSGFPKDGNLYHVVAEGVCVAAGDALPVPCCKSGGTIITASPMEEGIYNEAFFRYLKQKGTPAEVINHARAEGVTEPGQHRAFGLAKVLVDHRVVVAQPRMGRSVLTEIGLEYAPSVQAALDEALERAGENAKVLVMRNSHRLIPVCRH